MSPPAAPRLPCAVGTTCGKWVSSRSGVGLRPPRPFRVGQKELHAGALICRAHEPAVEYPYEHGCGAVVRCPDCLGELADALPIGWEAGRGAASAQGDVW